MRINFELNDITVSTVAGPFDRSLNVSFPVPNPAFFFPMEFFPPISAGQMHEDETDIMTNIHSFKIIIGTKKFKHKNLKGV